MLTLERQDEIVKYLKRHKTATVTELSRLFFIGPASIRRDLQMLEKQNLVKRTYGGAVLLESLNNEITIAVRARVSPDAKDRIAQIAASFVEDDDIIVIDGASTSFRMIPYLKGKSNLTVITNGVKTAAELGVVPHMKVYCCGGRLRENSLTLVGDQAKRFIKSYGVQKLFFSCTSFSTDMGAMDPSDDEAELKRVMIEQSDKVFLLCDSSKFGKKSFYQVCCLDAIHHLITETQPSREWKTLCKEHGVTVTY